MAGVSPRLFAICVLFTFGSLFSATLIFLEYNHLAAGVHGTNEFSAESSRVAELQRQLKERDLAIETLKNSENFDKLQAKIKELEEQINKQRDLEDQLSSLEKRLDQDGKEDESPQQCSVTPPPASTALVDTSAPDWKKKLYENWGAPVLSPTSEEASLQKKLFEKYVEIHKAIMGSSVPDTEVKKQYILLQASGSGLGNEVEAAISCLLLGILTDRALLINNAVTGYWTSAVPGLSFQGEPSIGSPRQYYSFRGGIDDFKAGMPLFETFSCSDLKEAFKDIRVLDISSNQYFVPILANNAHYKDMIKKTFGKDIFGALYKYFLKPNDGVQKRLDEFKAKYWNDYYIIGIHMRREYIRTRQHPLSTNVFFRCAQQMTPNVDGVKTKIFLATDHGPYREEAKAFFGDDIITADGSQEMDILLLGECDDVIGTTGSTYSEVAFARASKLPLKVSEVQLCFRDVTSQPCFFFYKVFMEVECNKGTDFYSPMLYDNPIFLNQRNCYHNFQWGSDHI